MTDIDKADLVKLLEAGMTPNELFRTLADIEAAAARNAAVWERSVTETSSRRELHPPRRRSPRHP
jgi:hypothetical protein